MAQDARAAIKIKRNKLLDISYNILYTWTAAGDGGIYYREELVGGTRPRKKRRACGRDPPVACELVVSACGRDPPGGENFFKKRLGM